MSCGKGLLKVELRVEVRDKEGNLMATRKKESDLILDNFRDVLAVLLRPYEDLAPDLERRADLVDLAGTARSPAIWANTVVTSGQGLNFTGALGYGPALPTGVRIAIGTSTVAPTRADYKLGSEVAKADPSQTVGADYISWAVSIVLEAAKDIAEAGLGCVFQLETGVAPAWKFFFLFRDTFTPISVPAGGTISITYTLTL